MLYVIDSYKGIFLVNEKNEIVDFEAWDREKMMHAVEGPSAETHGAILSRHSDNEFSFEVAPVGDLGVKYRVIEPNEMKIRRAAVWEYLIKKDGAENARSGNKSVATDITKKLMSKAFEARDKLIGSLSELISQHDKTFNSFAMKIRECYTFHFPELDKIVSDHEAALRIIAQGPRETLNLDILKKLSFPEDKAREIVNAAANSIGASFDKKDIEMLSMSARVALDLKKNREEIAKRIDEATQEIAPNLSAIAEPSLAARLIALAGGLQRLARISSSKIQILGAEKALFLSLRGSKKPPKHGVIFQHPLVHNAPPWLRGKIARALAGKLAIAARVDANSGAYVADSLMEKLMSRVEEIKKLPPPTKKEQVKGPRKKKKRGGKK